MSMPTEIPCFADAKTSDSAKTASKIPDQVPGFLAFDD
jgi:hypothetical protein